MPPGLKNPFAAGAKQVHEEKPLTDDLGAEVKPIEEDIAALEAAVGSLAALRDEMLSTGRRRAKEAHDAQLTETETIAARATGRVRQMEARTRHGSESGAFNTAIIKQRLLVSARLTQRLLDVTQRHWADKSAFDARIEGQVARRVQVRYTDANGVHKSEAECQEMARQMLTAKRQAFLFMQARSILDDAINEYLQIEALQQDVFELLGLIKHMKRLVTWQQQQLAEVERHVDEADKHLVSGVENLKQVRKGELFGGLKNKITGKGKK